MFTRQKVKLLLVIVLAVLVWSCGQSNKDETKEASKTVKNKSAKIEINKITVEKYCSIYNEIDELIMEKYWDKFKGKKYDEVKDIYAQYKEKENAIYTKYDIDKPLKLSSFFRTNFKEIRDYRANDPRYKEYPERSEAKKLLVDFAMAKYAGK